MSVGHVLFSATLHRDLRGKPLTRSADAPFKPCPGVVPVSDTGTRPGAPSQAQPLRKTHRPEPIGPATQQDGPDGPLNRPLWRVSLVQREREERHEVSAGVITHLHPRRVSRAADRAGAGNANSGRGSMHAGGITAGRAAPSTAPIGASTTVIARRATGATSCGTDGTVTRTVVS